MLVYSRCLQQQRICTQLVRPISTSQRRLFQHRQSRLLSNKNRTFANMSGKTPATAVATATPATQEPVAKSSNETKPPTPTQEKRVFDETTTSVRINDDEDGEEFTCDEEPHMLGPELGYGYFPVALGQFIHGGKLEIVRKLGWATSSSVWLARTHE